jgi:uncharacterized repeat protein (TIGR03803 family)
MKRRTLSLPIFTLTIFTLALMFAALAATAQTVVPLYTYPDTDNGSTGVNWPALFAQGTDGELYSTIQTNGTYNAGTVYKISTEGVYTAVYNFCAEGGDCLVTGGYPRGGVTLGTDGNLYGTTADGGTEDVGTVFEVTDAGTLTTLWDFTAGLTSQHLNDEGYPIYPPVEATNGDFYGVDDGVYGGTYGVFYKMTPKGKLTAYPFDYTDGYEPNLPTQGADGNFYGTTQFGGGTCNCGVVYKATTGGKITPLHVFTGYVSATDYDGNRPIGVLVQDNDGYLWGTTYQGGEYNEGTIFKIATTGKDYELVYSFQFAEPQLLGQLPVAGLTLGTDGNLYGVTAYGGTNNYGATFQVTPAGDVTFLYSFCSVAGCADGIVPETPLIQHTNGKFYGTASGNSLCCGTFFSFDMGLPPFTRMLSTEGKVGATVDFLGQGFTSTTSVSFNGTLATSFKIISDTLLSVKIPVGALTGLVKIITSSGTLLSNQNFKVLPTVKTISPTSGVVGTVVTITGTGLTQATKVTFGGKAGTFTVNSDSQITATVPTTAKTGKIEVTTPGGAASSSTTFTVTP